MESCCGCRKLIQALSYGEDQRKEKEELKALLADLRKKFKPVTPNCPTCGLDLAISSIKTVLGNGSQELRQKFTCQRCINEKGKKRAII